MEKHDIKLEAGILTSNMCLRKAPIREKMKVLM
jgi:hypothetical protein